MLQFLIAAKWGASRDDQDCEDLFASLGYDDDSILTAENFEDAFRNDEPPKRAWLAGPRPANRVRRTSGVRFGVPPYT